MEDQKQRLENLRKALFIDQKKEKVKKLEERLEDESLWKDWEEGQKVSQDLSMLKKDLEDLEMLELLLEEGDTEKFETEIKVVELKSFLSEKYDIGNAIVAIHAGQGGTEAMDWTEMLHRMYLRYTEKNNWKVEEISRVPGEEAGFKSISFEVSGPYSYGFLKKESGVHRLVRLSPFNADNLRQTSFALVEVTSIIEDDIEIDIKEEDLEWDFFRASGHGGQNVNKVSSAVRLKHLPSGIVIECQEERAQGKNREKALKILKSKLYIQEQELINQEKSDLKGEFKTPGWGNQIRNYVLHPYKLVKDLRTNVESTNPEEILDGNLDIFIDAEIRLNLSKNI